MVALATASRRSTMNIDRPSALLHLGRGVVRQQDHQVAVLDALDPHLLPLTT